MNSSNPKISIQVLHLTTHHMASDQCPECHSHLDACKGISDAPNGRPAPGHRTVCAYCATLLLFTETGLERGTQEDLSSMPTGIRIVIEKALGKAIRVREAPSLSA